MTEKAKGRQTTSRPGKKGPKFGDSDSDQSPVIRLDGVYKSFGDIEVLYELSLEVAAGETTVVIGASGSGKTVLVKHMNGLVVPDRGTVELFGVDTSDANASQLERLRKRIGTLFQSYALMDSMTVVENVAFPLVETKSMDAAEAEDKAVDLLDQLGLGDAVQAYPAELSGGMKKRVSLARALISDPEVLLLDEPTTGLDPVMTAFVDDMIEQITDDYDLTNVIITHDIASAYRLADSIAILYEGQIIAHDTPARIQESDDERVEALLRGGKYSVLEESEASKKVTQIDPETATVYLDDVYKSFGTNRVLEGVTFAVPPNKITALIGGSGTGKSVIMKHILGLMRADAGDVWVFGERMEDLDEPKLRKLRTRIGMLFQHGALFDSMTVATNVAFPVKEVVSSRSDSHPRSLEERLDRILERLKIEDVRHKYPPEISSGQLKRVALARALITEPDLLIFDEPTTGQDPVMSKYVEDLIADTHEEFDFTAIVISHHMAAAFRLSDRIALLSDGVIAAEDAPGSLLESNNELVREFVYATQDS